MLNQLQQNPPSLNEGFNVIYTKDEWLKGMTLDEKIAYAKNPSHEEIQENQDIEAAKALTADELRDRIKETLKKAEEKYR